MEKKTYLKYTKKIMIIILGALCASRVYPADVMWDTEKKKNHNLVDLWFGRVNDSPQIRIADAADAMQQQQLNIYARESGRPVAQATDGQNNAVLTFRLQAVVSPYATMSGVQSGVQPHIAKGLLGFQMQRNAVELMQQDKAIQSAYEAVSAKMAEIAHQVETGTMHDRLAAAKQLDTLRTAYDDVCKKYSLERLEAAKQYAAKIQGGESLYGVVDRHYTPEGIAQLERNVLGARYLAQELNNAIDALQVSLFHDSGGFVADQKKEFGGLINNYQKQYIPGNTDMVFFPKVDKAQFKRIEEHRSNIAINGISSKLAAGDLTGARQIVQAYDKTWSQEKYKAPVRECFKTNPHLNEYGIPRIWTETNPRWNGYKEQLKAKPQEKGAIFKQLHKDFVRAKALCVNAGVDGLSHANIQAAHQLLTFSADPHFATIAKKALRDPGHLADYLCELERRDGAFRHIHNAAAASPAAKSALCAHADKLLRYALDPQTHAVIDSIAADPSRANALMQELADRNRVFVDMMRKLKPGEYTAPMEGMAYDLVGAKNDVEQLSILGGLYSDHKGNADLNPYAAFYDQSTHLPKIFEYDQGLVDFAKNVHLPQALGTREFTPERTLYAQVMRQPVGSELQRAQAQQCVDLLKSACVPGAQQDAYRALAQLASEMYLQSGMQPSEGVRAQNIELCNKIAAYINAGDFESAASNMYILQSELGQFKSGSAVSTQIENFVSKHATINQNHVFGGVQDRAQKIADYNELRNIVRGTYARTGDLSDGDRSREEALAQMAQGDFSIQTKHYNLTPKAQQLLDEAGIDKKQFMQHSGNLIQQDTNAKLVDAANLLASTRPQTEEARNIQSGTIDCIAAAQQLNQEGQAAQAMIYTDFCCLVAEKVMCLDPVNIIADTTAKIFHLARAHDLADSIEALRAKADAFRAGALVGVVQGVTDVQGIYNGLCSTVDALQDLVHFLDDVYRFEDALENGRLDTTQPILDRNTERCERMAARFNYLAQEASAFANNAPNMSVEKWRQAGLTAGNFVGTQTAQTVIIQKSFSGLGKIVQGVAEAIGNVTTQELALAAQLSGGPVEGAFVSFSNGAKVENVFVQNGSIQVTGIAAVHPEFASPVLIQVGEQLVDAAVQGAQSGAAGAVALVNTLTDVLTETKPGFIQLLGGSGASDSSKAATSGQSTEVTDGSKVVVELQHVLDGNKIDVAKVDLANLPRHLYDEAICSGEKLQQLTNQFKNTPGALGGDGPLQKAIEMGYTGANPGCHGTARGALYELEVAARLEQAGEEVCGFGAKYKIDSIGYRDFDIELGNRLIECKNINWDKIPNVTAVQTKFAGQNLIASTHGKMLEVYSKQPIPQYWKDWFSKKNILFKEG